MPPTVTPFVGRIILAPPPSPKHAMRISEIILYCEDMQKQVEFYRDKLELSLVYPPDKDDYSDEFWVVFDTGECKLCLHGGGEKRMGEDAPKFVFDVEDVEETQLEFLQRGIPMGKIRSPAPGLVVCDGYDPERNKFSVESREG